MKIATFCLMFAMAVGSACQAASNKACDEIDRLVFDKLTKEGIPASEYCSDEVFLRRVYLDMIGTLPTKEETLTFLESKSLNKRSDLIEELFKRDEFADYWSMKWCDLLRVKAEFPSKLWPNAVQAYYRWIHTAVQHNMPYDEFARTLLISSGSNFREGPVNFYRAMPAHSPEETARIVALTFMGIRTDRWDRDKLLGMAAFFGSINYKGTAEWKEEIVYHDPSRKLLDPETNMPVPLRFPDGTLAEIPDGADPRPVFAEWLIGNPAFDRNIANRIWYWLLGRGIIHEADDIHPDNPPQNKALLDFLAGELESHDYDLRHLYRIILNSRTYQLSSIHNEANQSDQTNFSHYYMRRLDAEVLIDAICQITGTTESYSSDIPEPFTFIPENERSIRLADGSITSPFLELFGRPPRDSGFESERNNNPSSAQKLYLLNSTHIQEKIRSNGELLGITDKRYTPNKQTDRLKNPSAWKPPRKALDDMYLTILSRHPTPEEFEIAKAYVHASELSRYDASIDIVWALLNSKEFIFRH
ncbi:MAG: DUF1553 domain-containing protein [Pontiellaceae bacterium]|nr:DUF1553 domain-containing protein [Pontiellaceae bacterium]MBN2786449.1 DUF1553 domain-containing protein [Pontiellaceae bacterium]